MKFKFNNFAIFMILFILSIFVVYATINNITQASPENVTWTNNTQPVFSFQPLSDINDTFSCELFVDDVSQGTNATTLNNTLTTIIPSTTLTEGTHNWYVNCTDVNGTAQSGIRLVYVDITNTTVTINEPADTANFSASSVELNFTITDNLANSLNYTVYINGVASANNQTNNNTATNITLTGLPDGTFPIVVEGMDLALNRKNSSAVTITVDTTKPFQAGIPTRVGDLDGYYVFGNLFNLTVNITDMTTGVNNVTFDATNICTGVNITKTNTLNGLWQVNCTVDQTISNFQPTNITFTACDLLGNCNNTLYYTIILFNFSYPPDQAGFVEFDQALTTDLSSVTNLNDVGYNVALRLNGTVLPGQPWQDMKLATHMNFSSLDFTNTTTQTALQNLATAIDITIRNPKNGGYGGSRININTTAFAALDTSTTVRLYNLPFSSLSAGNIINDTGGTGGISGVSYVANGDGTGNLTFTVEGFSGYNVTDTINPAITVNLPANHTVNTSFIFNATFNGTGTEIDNSTINLTLVASDSSISYYNYSNMTCAISGNNEVYGCNLTAILSSEIYNFSIAVKDFGGISGNSATAYGSNITIDTVNPAVSLLNAPANNSNVSNADTVTFNFSSYDNLDPSLSYTLFLNGVANETGTTTGNNTNTSFTVANLQNSSTYNWTIQVADDMANAANFSGVYYFTVIDNTPLTSFPTLDSAGVNDSDSDGNIEIGWTSDSNASSYKIYRNTENITNATSLTAIGSTTLTSFEDNTTTNATTYWYAVTSLDGTGNENKSVISASFNATANDSIVPKSPSNANATTNSDGSVWVTWNAVLQDINNNTDTNITYRVFRTTNVTALDTTNSTENIANTTNTNYTDTGMTTATNYSYVITSADDGNNHNSSKVSANQKSIVPAACTTSYGSFTSWSSCSSGGSQSRTASRTCYGGGSTITTETQTCNSGSSESTGTPTIVNPTIARTWSTLSKNEQIVMEITTADFGITTIELSVNKELSGARISVKKYDSRPSLVSEDASENVYIYLSIDKSNLENEDILKDVDIKFKVQKSWLKENSVHENNVMLMRYVDGKWTELATTKLSSDKDYVYYTAKSTGFSYFAIAEKRNPDVALDQEPETAPENNGTQAQTNEIQEPPKEESQNNFVVFLIIAAVIALALVFFIFKNKKKIKKHK